MGRKKGQIVAVMATTAEADNEETAFPAPEQTPGQRESRSAYLTLLERKKKPVWWEDYLELRAAGLDWRKAVYVAWASSPIRGRWPKSQEELAVQVLGLRSDRTIRKWRENEPKLDEMIAHFQAAPLLRYRRDVFDALVLVAKRADPDAHQDRKMFLTMTGDYKEKKSMALTGADGGPIEQQQTTDFSDLSDDELEQVIRNLTAAA